MSRRALGRECAKQLRDTIRLGHHWHLKAYVVKNVEALTVEGERRGDTEEERMVRKADWLLKRVRELDARTTMEEEEARRAAVTTLPEKSKQGKWQLAFCKRSWHVV